MNEPVVIYSRTTKKPALLQDKLFFFNYPWVLDDYFAVVKMAVDKLFTETILILSRIGVWWNKRGHPHINLTRVGNNKRSVLTRSLNLFIKGLILFFCLWRWRRSRQVKTLAPDADLRENVMPYFEAAGSLPHFFFQWIVVLISRPGSGDANPGVWPAEVITIPSTRHQTDQIKSIGQMQWHC